MPTNTNDIQYQAALQVVVDALSGVIAWAENHDVWWVDCPEKGGIDIERLQRVIDQARSLTGSAAS